MADGQKITFSGEGDQEPGLEPGDIIIVLDEKEHGTFKRSGTDLIMKFNINITEALCGFKKTVTTLDDRTLVIQTIPGKLVILPMSGAPLRISNDGSLNLGFLGIVKIQEWFSQNFCILPSFPRN